VEEQHANPIQLGSAVERPANNASVHAPANETTNSRGIGSTNKSAGNTSNTGDTSDSNYTTNKSNEKGVKNADSTGNSNSPIKPSTENQTSIPSAKSHNDSSDDLMPLQSQADHPANESSKLNTNDSENIQKQDKLTKQEQARLHSLKAMLNASNARYEKATRNRRPKFSAGLEIMIVSGDHSGQIGVVLDADYIANRALISLSDQESPHWIDFRYLGHAD